MNNIKPLIENYSVSDARSALYYLGRYLKGAKHSDEYQKDIFEEDLESAPGQAVKALTIALVEFIERSQGKKAALFTDQEYFDWMDYIDLIENELEAPPSENQIAITEKLIQELELPIIKK